MNIEIILPQMTRSQYISDSAIVIKFQSDKSMTDEIHVNPVVHLWLQPQQNDIVEKCT